jgi:hypothetical protein
VNENYGDLSDGTRFILWQVASDECSEVFTIPHLSKTIHLSTCQDCSWSEPTVYVDDGTQGGGSGHDGHDHDHMNDDTYTDPNGNNVHTQSPPSTAWPILILHDYTTYVRHGLANEDSFSVKEYMGTNGEFFWQDIPLWQTIPCLRITDACNHLSDEGGVYRSWTWEAMQPNCVGQLNRTSVDNTVVMTVEIAVFANSPPHSDYPVVEVHFDDLFDEGSVDLTLSAEGENSRQLFRLNEADATKYDGPWIYPTTFDFDCITIVNDTSIL